MKKPLSVARVEFVNTLSEVITKSGLPTFMLADIFKDTYTQLLQLANDEYAKELELWKEDTKEEDEC